MREDTERERENMALLSVVIVIINVIVNVGTIFNICFTPVVIMIVVSLLLL